MYNILIISSSIRSGRKSDRIARYFERYILDNQIGEPEIFDLAAQSFPLFEERLKFQKEPMPALQSFAEKVKNAHGIIIVTPEYNGGYPASLKNLLDTLTDEWYRKPVAISMVSAGPFGGMQVITSLQFSLWKLRAWTVPAMFPVPMVDKNFEENGQPVDPEGTGKRAAAFFSELSWCMQASSKMKD